MKKLIVICLTMLSLSGICIAQQIGGFTHLGEFNGHAYYRSDSAMHWTEARDACVAAGGHLATISSAEENAFLWDHLGAPSSWIGFTDSSVEGQWEWVTGEPVTYTNWSPGNPDNNGGDQDYANIWPNYIPRSWDDYSNDGLTYAALEVDYICYPTTLPFIDNFDSPELDSCWTWIREDTSHWSLTERSGWMRIVTQSGQDNWPSTPQCCLENKLLREITDGDLRISCKLAFQPNAPFQQAGILVFKDEDNFIWAARSYGQDNAGQQCFIMAEHNGGSWQYQSQPVSDTLVYVRVDKIAETYAAYISADSVDWVFVGSVTNSLSTNGVIKVGVYGATGPDSTVQEIPADFDYFRVDPLPGTSVCGEVSGVWNSAGSPYYVNCDVTVPAGQTLEIQPGVEVQFTGHYKLTVYGSLRAIGTEQDSIVFTRAFPTEDSKWAGIRTVNASDTVRLDHCVIEYGNATGGWPDGYGGGLLALGSSIEITNTTFQHNTSYGGAAGARMTDCPYVRVQHSIFQFNSAGSEGAGGGLQLHGNHPNTLVNNCLFYANHCDGPGGGVEFDAPGQISMRNCTIVENNSPWGGSGLASSGHNNVSNCIFWGNTGSPQVLSWYMDFLAMTYSDVQGGYDGIGNIDADPLFVDAGNANFHLSEQSPCIDSGDPASPKDSDSTRTDMGAYQFVHTKLMAIPAQLNFGLIDLGTDSTMQIELFNPTAAPISVEGVSNGTNVFSFDTVGLGGQVAPFSAYDLNVLFAPSLSGIYADTLDITTGQQEDSVIRVPLLGEARVILPPVDSLVAQKGPLNGIRLDWAAVTHSITGQPVQDIIYIIYGSTTSDGPFVPFGYSTTNNYVHAFILNTQSAYFYQVTADVSVALARHGSGLLPNVENK